MEDKNQTAQTVTTPDSPKGKNPLVKIVVMVLVVGLIVFAALSFVNSRKDKMTGDKMMEETSQAEAWDPDGDPNVDHPRVEVLMTEEGFSPETVTVEVGTVVVWNNQSGETGTVNSSPHPEHTDNPLMNLGELADGDKFSLVLDAAGTYEYHDHLHPERTGTIVVSETDLE